MKKIFFLMFLSVCLCGEVSTEGEFFAHITQVFSITVSVKTLSKDLGVGGGSSNMGRFTVAILDTVTSPPPVTHNVMLFSTMTDPDDNTQVQIVRQTNLDGGAPATQFPTRIDVDIEDDLSATGAPGPTAITNNQTIRTRVTTEAVISPAEVHTLTFTAQAHDGNKEGNYRTMIYFSLVTS